MVDTLGIIFVVVKLNLTAFFKDKEMSKMLETFLTNKFDLSGLNPIKLTKLFSSIIQ